MTPPTRRPGDPSLLANARGRVPMRIAPLLLVGLILVVLAVLGSGLL